MKQARNKNKKLIEQVCNILQSQRYAERTQQTYIDWIQRFLQFHSKCAPKNLTEVEVKVFLSHLAVDLNAAASTQNQALSAILFLFRHVLDQPLNSDFKELRVHVNREVPTILSVDNVDRLFQQLRGTNQLIAKLLYGTGMRLNECISLRVRDIDFKKSKIIIRDFEGTSKRTTLLPQKIQPLLKAHLLLTQQLHQDDLAQGNGATELPVTLIRKYPNAAHEWKWQYVFPGKKRIIDPEDGQLKTSHINSSGLQKAINLAGQNANIPEPISTQTLRHSFAAHLLKNGYDIHIVQKLLGHKDIKSTMVYMRLIDEDAIRIRSPLDH